MTNCLDKDYDQLINIVKNSFPMLIDFHMDYVYENKRFPIHNANDFHEAYRHFILELCGLTVKIFVYADLTSKLERIDHSIKYPQTIGDWTICLDEASNKLFYYNKSQEFTTWKCPPELETELTHKARGSGINLGLHYHKPVVTTQPAIDDEENSLPANWEQILDKVSNRYYYFNRETNITQWEFPE